MRTEKRRWTKPEKGNLFACKGQFVTKYESQYLFDYCENIDDVLVDQLIDWGGNCCTHFIFHTLYLYVNGVTFIIQDD